MYYFLIKQNYLHSKWHLTFFYCYKKNYFHDEQCTFTLKKWKTKILETNLTKLLFLHIKECCLIINIIEK